MKHDAVLAVLVLTAGAVQGACAVSPDAPADPSEPPALPAPPGPQRPPIAALTDGCDEFLCGANGPMIGGLPFWEIDTSPAQPLAPSGLAITKVTDPHGVVGQLVVDGAQVTFVAPGHPTIGKARLVGTELSIVGPPASGTSGPPRMFTVTIEEYHPVLYVPGASGPPIDSYRLGWRADAAGVRAAAVPTLIDVCPALEADDGVLSGNAILYGGERFDPGTGQITASGEAAGAWVNVACAGDLRAKLARIGYYPATQHTTVDDRQAAVWMFSARYCGAESYTHLGVKLDWRLRGDASLPPDAEAPEAIWTAQGAACLSTPRAVKRETVACAEALAECDKAMFGAEWQAYGVLASTVPK